MIEKLSKKAEIPKPKVYIMPVMSTNAFATGRDPEHASVAVTEGILQILSKSELEGVLAHELAHIKNRDILISTVAATIAGAISFIAFMARWAAIFGGLGGRDSGNSIIELLVLAILAPILALIIRLAISRSREYLADESGAKLVGDGKPLATALQKISAATNVRPMPIGNNVTSHMFIVAPFKNFLTSIFSTHPAVEKRVEKLEQLKF
jgi:heat shock protein HtpX